MKDLKCDREKGTTPRLLASRLLKGAEAHVVNIVKKNEEKQSQKLLRKQRRTG